MRPLTQDLFEFGLLSARDVVDGELCVEPMASRHHSVRVTRTNGDTLFVKRAAPGSSWLIQRESVFYNTVAPHWDPTKILLTDVVATYDDQATMVLSYAEGLVEMSTRAPRVRLGRALAARVGRALAEIHATPCTDAGFPGASRPHGLELHLPWVGHLATMTPGAVQFTRLVQSIDGLIERIDEIARGWREDTYIHADLKAGHLLVPRTGSADVVPVVVDWECAGPGDAAWDLGCVVAMYALGWLRSIPASGRMEPAELAAAAVVPMRRVRPATAAFWSSYLGVRGLDENAEREHAQRTVAFVGVRLLQSVSEELQVQERMTAGHVATMQVALNLLLGDDVDSAGFLGLRGVRTVNRAR